MYRFLVAVLLFLGTTSINAQNLVINPGFENGGSVTPYLTPWTAWYNGGNTYRSSNTPCTGTYCGTVVDRASISQIITLTENTAYILRAKYKARSGSVSVGVKNFSVSDGTDGITVETTSMDWITTGDIAFKTGVGKTSATIFIFSSGPGNSGSGDDFSVTAVDATGLNQTENNSNVYSINSEIIVKGLEGQTAVVYSIDGQFIKSIFLTSNQVKIRVNNGLYIVKLGTRHFKLMIK